MIPDSLIDLFPEGMYVIHPSLLPKYRGSCPIQHAILNNEKETGVSIIEISKNKFDAGAILWQKALPFDATKTTFQDLAPRLADLGGDGMLEILGDLDKFRSEAVV
jgi:methionyl-tRNA formyltransferase